MFSRQSFLTSKVLLTKRFVWLGLTHTLFVVALLCLVIAKSFAQTTISVFYLAEAEATEERYRVLTEAFERANPDIKVERIRVIDDFPNRLALHIVSGTLPDVISLDMNYIMEFGDERILYDLSPYFWNTPGYEPEMVAKPMLDVFTVDGKLFAAPMQANPAAYMFNLDMFEQAGLVAPHVLYAEDQWTWEAFRDAARKLTSLNPDGTYNILGTVLNLPRTWIHSNGGREVDDPHRPTRAFFNEPEAREALHFLQELVVHDRSMVQVGSALRNAIGANETVGFAQGRIGMSSRWLASLPAMAEGPFDVGFVPYPKGPSEKGKYASDLGMFGLSISKNTQHFDAAWRYVAFLTGPNGAASYGSTLAGLTPARPADLRWIFDAAINPEVYPDLLTYGTIRIISRDRQALWSIIDGQLANIWNNVTPVETAAAEITRLIETFIAENPQ